jgi:paraquat-inducible protein B
MSKPANKTLIGAFVVGAVALAVAGLLVFGSGKFFAPLKKFVMFFGGSVKGLNVGSPVIFRGVKIGEVTDIKLIVNPKEMTAVIPVYVEIDPRLLTVPEEFKPLLKETEKKYVYIQPLIKKGLKAQLQMQSFVTGQLMINLDFYPDKPIRLVGTEKKYPEIPTVPTAMEELTKTIQDLPIKELVTKLELTVDGIQKLVNSPETRDSIESLNLTLKDTQKLVQHIDEQIVPLMSSLAKTSDTAHETLSEAKNTMSVLRDDAKETLEAARDALKQTEKTLGTFSEDSRLVYEMNKTLKSLSEAARSLHLLSDYLERHPEALLRGKPKHEGVSK